MKTEGSVITLTIDNQTVEVPEGMTILEAAQAAGIAIPTMCHLKGFEPSTSCMVCVVRVEGVKSLIPACGALVMPHMHVTTDSDEIRAARKTAIELLLSDHVGDCLGPCQMGCPAGMDIPQMLRHIAAGDHRSAIEVIKHDIPLPGILGRICPAPCEKVCRRAKIDQPVAICRLKRFVADVDLFSDEPFTASIRGNRSKTVAIVGAGPCGLSAAYYLACEGFEVILYDEHDYAGGALRYGAIDRDVLPIDIVDKETQQILSHNISFRPKQRVGREITFAAICEQSDAVLISTGDTGIYDKINLGPDLKNGKIPVNRKTYASSLSGVFAAGGVIGSRRLAVRAVADGKEAAFAIAAWLEGKTGTAEKIFNSRMGVLSPEEHQAMRVYSSESPRHEPNAPTAGFEAAAARAEAKRCLHCDCRKADNCRLRDLSTAMDAKQNVWQGERKTLALTVGENGIVYEPGKCILCGLCIQTAKRHAEVTGVAFAGRGFAMRVDVPFEKTLAMALTYSGNECVKNCPTGALCRKTES